MEIQNFDQFKEFINSEKITIVDFFATWCGPCKMLSPIFHEVANELKDQHNFLQIDIDKFNEIASMYQIQSVPTLIFFKNGEEVFRHIGFIDSTNLKSKIDSLK